MQEGLKARERRSWRKQFESLTLSKLQDLKIELLLTIDSKSDSSEIAIARRHFDPMLVDRVIRNEGKNRRLQTIFCSADRCINCPHGPHWYIFRRIKGKDEVKVIYDATEPSLDDADLEVF